MLHLFVPPISFDHWGEYQPSWVNLSQIFGGLLVAASLAVLTFTLCLALATLFAQPAGFGPPPSQHLALLM
jgi:hypothetical protein